MCTADDEYDGYFIPKGTVVLGNTWSVSSWLDWSKTIRDSDYVLKGDSTQSRTISWTWGIQTWALPERWCIGSYCPRPKFCGVWLWSSVCICLFVATILCENDWSKLILLGSVREDTSVIIRFMPLCHRCWQCLISNHPSTSMEDPHG